VTTRLAGARAISIASIAALLLGLVLLSAPAADAARSSHALVVKSSAAAAANPARRPRANSAAESEATSAPVASTRRGLPGGADLTAALATLIVIATWLLVRQAPPATRPAGGRPWRRGRGSRGRGDPTTAAGDPKGGRGASAGGGAAG
jgi:hypothetical protein